MKKVVTEKNILITAGILLGILTTTKFILATRFPLFVDEAFYWLCAQYPAPAYIDHPFMTAFLVKLGTMIAGDSYLGVRCLFLIIGFALPFFITLSARPFVGRYAWLAGAASLTLPHFASLGILATPDVPLTFFGLLAFMFFERATRKNDIVSWSLTGITFAFGFSTHYRFIVVLAGLLMYLVLTQAGRNCLKKAGVWISFAIGSFGLLPVILYNVNNNFQSIKFQFLERHPWEFQPEALLQPLKQALMVTPLLYVCLIIVLIRSIKKARKGDDRHSLIACFALTHLAGYFLIGLLADQQNASVYWTWPGYIPLVIFLPELLKEFHEKTQFSDGSIIKRLTSYVIPITGLLGSAFLFIYIGFVSLPGLLNLSISNTSYSCIDIMGNLLPRDSIGWRESASRTRMILQKLSSHTPPVLVAHNLEMAPELAFELKSLGLPVYVLDHPSNIKNGRTFQHYLWGTDVTHFKQLVGTDALIVIDTTVKPGLNHRQWAKRLCKMFETVTLVDELSLLDGWRHFLYFRAKNLKPQENYRPTSTYSDACDFPPFGSLDNPSSGAMVSGSIAIDGWACHDTTGIQRIDILLNRKKIGTARYGKKRLDVKRAFPDSADPNLPYVGFEFLWNTTGLTEGKYLLSIRAVANDNHSRIVDRKKINISSEK